MIEKLKNKNEKSEMAHKSWSVNGYLSKIYVLGVVVIAFLYFHFIFFIYNRHRRCLFNCRWGILRVNNFQFFTLTVDIEKIIKFKYFFMK